MIAAAAAVRKKKKKKVASELQPQQQVHRQDKTKAPALSSWGVHPTTPQFRRSVAAPQQLSHPAWSLRTFGPARRPNPLLLRVWGRQRHLDASLTTPSRFKVSVAVLTVYTSAHTVTRHRSVRSVMTGTNAASVVITAPTKNQTDAVIVKTKRLHQRSTLGEGSTAIAATNIAASTATSTATSITRRRQERRRASIAIGPDRREWVVRTWKVSDNVTLECVHVTVPRILANFNCMT